MLIIKGNEILVGSDNHGFAHTCWLNKEKIIIKENALFLEIKEFDLSNENYYLSKLKEYKIQVNEIIQNVSLSNGVGKLNLDGLNDIFLLGEHYHLKGSKWIEGKRESFTKKLLDKTIRKRRNINALK